MSPRVQSSEQEKTHCRENPQSVGPHLSQTCSSGLSLLPLLIIQRNRANRIYVDKEIKRRFNIRVDSPWLWRPRRPMICHLPAGEPLSWLYDSVCIQNPKKQGGDWYKSQCQRLENQERRGWRKWTSHLKQSELVRVSSTFLLYSVPQPSE